MSVVSAFSQARKLLAAMKHKKRVLWANGVIYKYFRGWKVRQQYRPKFRRIAGPKISRFMITALVSLVVGSVMEIVDVMSGIIL